MPSQTSEDVSLVTRHYTPPQSNISDVSSGSALPEDGRFAPGSMLAGRYRITSRLGRGGMGEVYSATDLLLGQPVALKFLPPEAAGNRALLERFHGEVRIARQISHPNVCRVYDIGTVDDVPFISMEYFDGEDLAILLQRIGRLPVDKALEVGRSLCSGLATAHAKGIIHRDLKPANIMMNRRGEIAILDFGLAAVADQLSGAEIRNGTPAYMAPEQLREWEATAKSDIYSLGLILFELLTGTRPFNANTRAELIEAREAGVTASMSAIAPELDPSVEKTILACLDPDPSKRPNSARAVLTALPGGDPLAMAVASGHTPSPELLSAASIQGSLSLRIAVPLLLVVLGGLFAAPFFNQQKVAFFKARSNDPPPVLRYKAREIAASFGYTQTPADSAVWLTDRFDFQRFLFFSKPKSEWRQWLASESPIAAVCRESLRPMVAHPLGSVTRSNPPALLPGMLDMELDGNGRLRSFSAVPTNSPASPPTLLKPEAIFRAAQLDLSAFAPQPLSPPLPNCQSDDYRVWRGPHPVIPNLEITIGACSWRGQITKVWLTWPWMKPAAAQPSQPSQAEFFGTLRGLLAPLLTAACVVAFVIIGIRNFRRKRTDTRAAIRLAAVQLALSLLIWICTVHAVPSDSMIDLFLSAVSQALLPACCLFLLYVALEPEIRSRWPHSIVTWKQLLAGRWLSPDLNADLLKGAAIGVGAWAAQELLVSLLLGERLNTFEGLSFLNGTRGWLAGTLTLMTGALKVGLAGFFLVYTLRALVRKDWLAALIVAVLVAAMQSDIANADRYALAQLAADVVLFSGLIFVLLRIGLLVAICSAFFFNAMDATTLGLDFTAWYVPAALTTFCLIFGLALFAFARAVDHGELTTASSDFR